MKPLFKRIWSACLVLSLCFSACAPASGNPAGNTGSNTSSDPLSPEKLALLVGESRAGVLAALSLAEDAVTASQGMDLISQPRVMDEKSYSVYLLYDRSSGSLYAYQYVFSGDTEELLSLTASWMASFQSQYGDPATYPGLSDRYFEAADPAGAFAQKGRLSETWDLSRLEPYSGALERQSASMQFAGVVTLEKTNEKARLTVFYGLQANRS